MNLDVKALKQQAAEQAVEYVESGMVLGLGHGSTVSFALQRIAEELRAGRLKNIVGIPCSSAVEAEASSLGIPLATLDDHTSIDLTIDGADEVDPHLNLIKGGGGALLREKIVAQSSQLEIIVVDQTKVSSTLGSKWPVPVEVVPFGWRTQIPFLESLGARPVLRREEDGSPFKTDQGNLILDCHFGPIPRPVELTAKLVRRAGLLEHGLFVGLATLVIVGTVEGLRYLKP